MFIRRLIPSFDHMRLCFCLTLHTNVAPEMFYLVCLLNKLVVRLSLTRLSLVFLSYSIEFTQLGAKRLGANFQGGETTWGEFPRGRNDLGRTGKGAKRPTTLPYMGYIGICGPKGYGFSAVLVINRVSIIAIFPPLW